MNEPQMLFFEEAFTAAQYLGNRRLEVQKAIIASINKLTIALELKRMEKLFCFFSPHCAPRRGRPGLPPHGYNFVIPRRSYTYNKEAIKVVFWIMHGDESVADSKHGVFFSSDGWAQIADNDWCDPDEFAKEMRDHLRDKKQINFLNNPPREILAIEILPLLIRLEAAEP